MLDIIPFKRRGEFTDFFRGMDDLMRRTWQEMPFGGNFTPDINMDLAPRVDVVEDDGSITVKAELPGIEKKDIDIALEDDVLTIRGEKKQETEETGKHYHRVERSYGTFYRSLRLPAEVEREKIEAACKDGILSITLPKKEGAGKRITHVAVH